MTVTTATAAREQAGSGPQAKPLLLDVDVHPLFLPRDILPRLPEPWRTRYANEISDRGGAREIAEYPRWRGGGFRMDAAVPGGGPAGSDLDLLRAQLLEEYDTDIAVLIPLTFMFGGPADYKAALCRAINDWLAQDWLDRDPRLRGSLNVPFDSPDLAVAEIERFAGDPRFVQVMVRGDAQSEWGDRKYWPIYQAAAAAGFVLMCHVGGEPGNRYRGSGAPSYYLEQHVWLHMPVERLAMSLICDGVGPAGRARRGLPHLGGAAAVGDGRRLRGRWPRRAAAQKAAVGVLPRALLAEHAADRGTRQPAAPHPVDRVRADDGPGDVLLRLPALGLRLAGQGAARRDARGHARQDHGRERGPPLRPAPAPKLKPKRQTACRTRAQVINKGTDEAPDAW